MKDKPPVFLFLLLVAPSYAQPLVNGSFEDGQGNFTLLGWQHVCAVDSAAGAPGGGNVSARVEHGNFQGCFPGILYQSLPAVQSGEAYTFSAFVRNDPNSFGLLPVGIAMGTVDQNGMFDLTNGPVNQTNMWELLSMSHTFQLDPGDTAVVVLQAGSTSGPLGGWANFDSAFLSPTGNNGIQEQWPVDWDLFITSNGLEVWFTRPVNEIVQLTDALGRIVASVPTTQSDHVAISTAGLSGGNYIVQVVGEGTVTSQRITLP